MLSHAFHRAQASGSLLRRNHSRQRSTSTYSDSTFASWVRMDSVRMCGMRGMETFSGDAVTVELTERTGLVNARFLGRSR